MHHAEYHVASCVLCRAVQLVILYCGFSFAFLLSCSLYCLTSLVYLSLLLLYDCFHLISASNPSAFIMAENPEIE